MTVRGPVIGLENGVDLPAVGFGVYRASPEETAGAVSAALAAGYRMIDTAAAYFNEAEVGAAIRDSGVARAEVFVQTKAWISDYGTRRDRRGLRAQPRQARARDDRPLPPAPAGAGRLRPGRRRLERARAAAGGGAGAGDRRLQLQRRPSRAADGRGRGGARGQPGRAAPVLQPARTCARRTRGSASSPRPGRRSAASTATGAATSGRRTTRSPIRRSSASPRSTGGPRPR